jgi:hypothetical protein
MKSIQPKLPLIILILFTLGTAIVGCGTLPTYSSTDQYECELETAQLTQGKDYSTRFIIVEKCLENRKRNGTLKGPHS